MCKNDSIRNRNQIAEMNLEQRHSNANLKRLRDEISKLQNGDGKEPSPKEELKNQEMKKEEMSEQR